MNPRTTLTLANGRLIDLEEPKAADYRPLDFAAEHLAKENRYNGATPMVVYSVAQHSAEGAREILFATGDRTLAAYFTLHDVKEAVLKDDTTPKKNAIAAIVQKKFGVLAKTFMAEIFDDLEERHDRAIHEAAGLPWPPAPELVASIKRFDKIMLVTEWRDLMAGQPLPNAEAYAGHEPLTRKIKPMRDWQSAADSLLELWLDLLPAFHSFGG